MNYSRWERLHFKILGRWPQRVVDRRIVESDLLAAELRRLSPEDAQKAVRRIYGGIRKSE